MRNFATASYYNVPQGEGNLPDTNEFQFQEVTSLYLFLPPVAQQLDPSDAFVELPEDGTPPSFSHLREAVIAVLENDPEAGNFELDALTPQQSRHIAREMIPHPALHPLPEPPRPLNQMYTEPVDDDEDRDRRSFEGELQSYHAIHNANAERLSSFVFALSAAEANAATTDTEAAEAGLNVPVHIAETEDRAKIKATRIILTTTGAVLNPSFRVPAEYFYALARIIHKPAT